ncbi:unnamed protein product [Ectocarpus sp. 6 AP-2014]
MRPPSRQGRKPGNDTTNPQQPDMAAESKPNDMITVYTNSAVCAHGTALLAEIEGCLFNHVDISQQQPPSWLPGTPTVVHNNSVYCGDNAFAFVQNFDLPKSTQRQPSADAKFSLNTADSSFGCGLSKAFAPPAVIEVDESQFTESTDDAMQRLLAGRR